MEIEYKFFQTQKQRSYNTGKIDLYPYATQLWNALVDLGIIERLKSIPQLGVIKVPRKLKKSRYDYVILQLYFHQIVRKSLNDKLELSYNNKISAEEFYFQCTYPDKQHTPTIMDLLQLFTIAYNMGHFYNTFVASRATIMAAKENRKFKSLILNSSECDKFRVEANKLIDSENYHRFHLLNSLLILDKCTPSFAIELTKQLIYSYLNMSESSNKGKLEYVFRLFRAIRDIAYFSYDLQVADIPFSIDITNEEQLKLFFRELLSEYNDKTSIRRFVEAISKMLDDTVYYKPSEAICYYQISKRMSNIINKMQNYENCSYYASFWYDQNSILNKKYSQNKRYIQLGILKLTFNDKERACAVDLLHKLDHSNCVYAGYYDRPLGACTVLVSINKNNENKKKIAFRIFKKVISTLQGLPNVQPDDSRFLLAVKFLLFYYFGERPVRIKATVDEKVCVLCTRGKKKRIKALDSLMAQELGTDDQRHEVAHLKYCLEQNETNAITLLIPGSIVVCRKTNPSQMFCEFDGLILYPTKKEKQVVFMESKNMNETGKAKNCLRKKLERINLFCETNQIQSHGQDVYLYETI